MAAIGTKKASQAAISMTRGSFGMPSTPVSKAERIDPVGASQLRSIVRP